MFKTLEEAQAEYNRLKAESERLEANKKALEVDLEAAKKAVTTPPDVETLVASKISEAIADIKQKLDNAYKVRDEALAKVAEHDRFAAESKRAQLIAEGKLQEAADAEIAQLKAEKADLEKANTELARNNEVRQMLSAVEFRNDKAADIAFKEISSELIRNDKGIWVHSSGKSIKDFVGEFIKDENQSFLFKPKTNNGGGGNPIKGTTVDGKVSLFKMSQAEVIKAAAEGNLPKQRK